ncbi:MAG: cell wall-active antibiotics response protein, partial [candidate division Zixibacteria bacterium]|nr:cell wall-active antibiotics response protein [candidate division Zixibacteria bacterium]
YGKEPDFDFHKDGSQGKIKLKYKDQKHKFKSLRRKGCHSQIFITDKIPVDLDVDGGVVDMVLDLSELNIPSLDIDSGVSNLMVRFGSKSRHINATFDIGVSDLAIYIPEGTAVRLHKDTGLASVSYKDLGLKKIRKHLYESPGYDTAERTIDIDLDAGVSDIDLEYYDSGRAEL